MASLNSIFSFGKGISREEQQRFLKFIDNNVSELFSDVGNKRYHISNRLLVLSVINEGRVNYQGAKYRQIFKELSNSINTKQLNTKYQNLHMSEIFMMLHDSSNGSFRRLMNLVKKFLKNFEESDNEWNKVKYMYKENMESTGRFIK